MTESTKTYRVSPPSNSTLISKEGMTEAELRYFALQINNIEEGLEIWREKIEKDEISEALEWIKGRYFVYTMYFTQYHYVIWCLQNQREKYIYDGAIEASDFLDEYRFKSYRLTLPEPPKSFPHFENEAKLDERGKEAENILRQRLKLHEIEPQASLL